MARTGRPSDYSLEIATRICERLADGETMRKICLDPDMPSRAAVHQWLLKHDEFKELYGFAREVQIDNWADEIIETATEGAPDDTQRARLIVDTKKWIMARALPKKYGDRIEHDVTTRTFDISDTPAPTVEDWATKHVTEH